LFPKIGECATNPRISFEDITLKNITGHGNLLTQAGVIVCNASNPCKNFTFIDVDISSPFFGKDAYYTRNVYGKAFNSQPDPKFKPSMEFFSIFE
jgi:hypothetical protein